MTDKIVAFSTCSTQDEALKIARRLLDVRLAACVSISQPIRSLYHWQGAIQDDAEFMLVIKSRRDLVPQLAAALREVHSYTTPELVILPILDGLPDYLAWMDAELAPPPQPLA
jgi:periplasmic divalent cation tolerance protein